MSVTTKTWSGLFPVHPAADVFPMMSGDELDKLGADIKQNGLQNSIVLWQDNADRHAKSQVPYLLLDGRNRLAAMDRSGIPVPRAALREPMFDRKCAYKWRGEPVIPGGSIKWTRTPLVDPAEFVISANVLRRHLTKEQQADLILRTVEASEGLSATSAEKVEFTPPKPGRPKDPVLQKAVEEAAKQGISKRTVEAARARQQGKPKAPRKPKLELAPSVEPLRAAPRPLPTQTYEQQLEASVEYARREVEHAEAVLKTWREGLREREAVLENYLAKRREAELDGDR